MASVRPGSKDLIKEINETLVLDALRVRGRVARSELIRLTGLSPATITGITRRLVEAGLALEVSRGPSTGGRPPRILAMNPAGGHVIGAWLTPDRIEAVTVNLVGEIVDRYDLNWRADSAEPASPSEVEKALVTVAETLRSRSPTEVMGMGVTLSGAVDYDAGVVRHSGQLGWEEVPLGINLSQRLGMPVPIDQLVHALAAGLVLFGEGRGVDHMLVVSIGHSVSSGLVLDGRIYRGAPGGTTGSIVHTRAPGVPNGAGKLCHCGAHGCLETISSEWGMRAELAVIDGPDLDSAAKVADTDRRIQQIFDTAGRTLGVAIANLAKVIAPERIILGGEGTRLGAPLIEPFRKELNEALSGPSGSGVEIHVVHSHDQPWPRGAACQALTELFQVSRSRPAWRDT